MGPNGRPKSAGSGRGPRSQSPANSDGPPRPSTAHGHAPRSPPSPGLKKPSSPSQMGPGQFNQAPRPLSPGPVSRPSLPQYRPVRSQSPGPYGANAGPPPMQTDQQRRRSNSAGAVQARRRSPPGNSPLAHGEPMAGWRPSPQPTNRPRAPPGVAL
jgi:hypothetical protein